MIKFLEFIALRNPVTNNTLYGLRVDKKSYPFDYDAAVKEFNRITEAKELDQFVSHGTHKSWTVTVLRRKVVEDN